MSTATTSASETIPETHFDATDSLDEIVDGRRVEEPTMGNFQIIVASLLAEKLASFTRTYSLGRVVTEMLFKIHPSGGKKRRPVVAFVSFERWAQSRKINFVVGWDVIPELAIEVISPSSSADEEVGKVGEYFKAGVRRVWVVHPVDRLIYTYESTKKNTILDISDTLEDRDLLPGFRLSLAKLFEDAELV